MVRLLPAPPCLCLLVLSSAHRMLPAAPKRIVPRSFAETSGPAIASIAAAGPTSISKALPQQIGFQHGQLLAAEIADLVNVHASSKRTHDTKRDWDFYREAGRKMLWPHIDAEYQQELEGIAKGVAVQGHQARRVGHRRPQRRHRAA